MDALSTSVPRRRFLHRLFGASMGVATGAALGACSDPDDAADDDLWGVYERTLSRARYVSLSHVLEPTTPVWYGFDASRLAFGPSRSGNADVKAVGEPFTYDADGFEGTEYVLPTDQYGTQLDPPAHWNPNYPAIDELPVAIAVRPLVVISIVEQVAADVGYALSVADIVEWENVHGRVPAGSVVMVRSDWSTRWDDPGFASMTPFPGVSLDALKFLHLERHILLHGHEPLDTDATPTLEGESWLLNHGYLQAEGVTNLHLVPETGALVSVGFPRFRGGTGGLATFVAICPPTWPHGERPGDLPEAPMDPLPSPLRWDVARGIRVRD